MDQLDELDKNGHRQKTNINHSTTLFESEDGEGTKYKTKPKTPIIVISENE